MRIIRVNGCHECLSCRAIIGDRMGCYHNEDTHVELGEITLHFINKTLPDNCPLEKE